MNQIPGDPKSPSRLLRLLKEPFWIPVVGQSMLPSLKSGDFVRVEPIKSSELRLLEPGQIILLMRNGSEDAVVHRFIGKSNDWIYEYGDHSKIVRRVFNENVIGKVTHCKRNGSIKELLIPISWRTRNFLNRLKRATSKI